MKGPNRIHSDLLGEIIDFFEKKTKNNGLNKKTK
jgi:hypothetical protein